VLVSGVAGLDGHRQGAVGQQFGQALQVRTLISTLCCGAIGDYWEMSAKRTAMIPTANQNEMTAWKRTARRILSPSTCTSVVPKALPTAKAK
jgi:hypothetical protein